MFEWDKEKAKSNENKHSVSFPFASRAFEDDNRLTVIDNRSDYGEIRYITLARIEKRVYVLVYRNERKANKKEVKRYDNR